MTTSGSGWRRAGSFGVTALDTDHRTQICFESSGSARRCSESSSWHVGGARQPSARVRRPTRGTAPNHDVFLVSPTGVGYDGAELWEVRPSCQGIKLADVTRGDTRAPVLADDRYVLTTGAGGLHSRDWTGNGVTTYPLASGGWSSATR